MKKRILSTLLALCMALALLPGTGWAVETYSGTCGDNITWRISGDGTLFLDGKGNIPYLGGYYFAEPAPWEKYADSIKTIHVNEGITGINGGAFSGCNSATGIVLPASLQFIGSGAWPTGDKLMYVVTGFNSTNYIEYGGVLYAQNPATSESEVGKGVPSLVCYPPALKYAETSTYTVREGTKAIASYAFEGNKYVKEVVIPNSVQEIGYDAFRSCISLESVQLPKVLTELKGGTFENCISLKEINLPSGIRTVDISAFWFCDNLNTIIIPASVTQFGSDSFGYDGLSEEFNLHKDFYFRGSAPAFNLNGDLSLGGEFSLIRTDIYYPQNASGWDELIQSVGEQEYIKFYPYDWEGEDPAPEVKYSLSYDLNGGSGDLPSTQYYQNGTGLFVSPVVPTREGYTFTGWSDGSKTYQPGDGIIIQDRDVVLTAVWDNIRLDINDEAVFLNQPSGNPQCTLYANTVMLRRKAILEGRADWQDISIKNTSETLWTKDGMAGSYNYEGIGVTREGYGKIAAMDLKTKRNYFISLLDSRPEGIVIYFHGRGGPGSNSAGQHAILLTDYDAHTGTFYCADSILGSKNRIPLTSSTLPGSMKVSTQDDVLKNIHQIWFVSSVDRAKLLSRSYSAHCPVEMRVEIGSEALDSTGLTGTTFNHYAIMEATGSGADRSVTVTVQRDVPYSEDVSIQLIGTDTGSMTFIVEDIYTDGTSKTQTFRDVPLTNTTIATANIHPQSTVILTVNESRTGEETFWAANPGETATGPNTEFGNMDDQPEGPVNPPPIFIYPTESNPTTTAPEKTYPITLPTSTGGMVTANATSATKGTTVTLTTIPDEGYELSALTVTDNKGNELELTDKGNGKYTFSMPGGKVEVEVAFVPIVKEEPDVPESVVLPYIDVSAGNWFYDSVQYVYVKGLMTGDGDLTTFNPKGGMTRAMVWTVLGRMAGADVDGSGGKWYAKARDWAAASGVSDGSNPNGGITRQELAVMLWRSAGSPEGTADLGAFSDGGDVAGWASAAMQWAAANGILNGDNGMLKPGAPASRAEVAAMLMRFCEKTGR